MHLPPAAALRHFEQQPGPRPRLLPAGGRGEREGGGRDRISPANGTVPTGFGSPVSIPHSIPLPNLQASANNPESLLAAAQQPPTHKHTHRRRTRAPKGFATCSPRVHTARSLESARTERPHPHNLQMVPKVAICNPFLSSWLIGTLLHQCNSFLISPMKGFYTLQAVSLLSKRSDHWKPNLEESNCQAVPPPPAHCP